MIENTRRYNIRHPEEMKALVEDYFKLKEKNDSFYDLKYKDFKKMLLQKDNFKFLFSKCFLISMDDFLYIVYQYFKKNKK